MSLRSSQPTIDKYCERASNLVPTRSTSPENELSWVSARPQAGSDLTPESAVKRVRSLSQRRGLGRSVTDGASNTPANVTALASSTSDGATTTSSPFVPSVTPSNRRAAGSSRSPSKPRKAGGPRGLGTSEPCRKRKSESLVESGGSILQEVANKKHKTKKPLTSTQVQEENEQQRKEVMFRLKVAEMGLKEVFEIRAPQNQPILDALQADARLEKIKKKIPKIYLHPDGKTTVKGIPNIGSPCSVIEGGRFEARFGKDQNCNMYSDDELKCSERYKVYLDVRNRKNKTKWLTRRNPNSFDFPILVDCLPNDTLLTALLRDVRIDNERVRYTKLICKDSAGEINIKLTDKSSFHHDSVFTCHVLKTSQVSDEEWGKGCAGPHDRIYQTTGMSDSKKISTEIENIDPQVEIAMSGTDSSGSLQKDKVTLEVKKIIHGSQTQVAELLKVDFEQKESSNAERKRKRKLDQFAEPYRQDFYNANKGISVLLVEKLGKLARSVGVLVKNGNPYGTCFRLGSKYVMTNSHVTEMAEMAGICSNAFVFLNYKKSRDFDKQPSEDLLEFKVLRVVCSSQVGDLDYSLLELDIPDDQAERLPIGVGHKIVKQAQQNTTVTIIGHPGGRPKKVDPSCPVVGPNHRITVYLKFHPELWEDYAMVYDAKRNNYMSGFGSGASGSPGFDEDGNLVVMHACGYHLYDRSKTEVEQGVRMMAIRDDLKQHLPADLWDDLFLPPTESMQVD